MLTTPPLPLSPSTYASGCRKRSGRSACHSYCLICFCSTPTRTVGSDYTGCWAWLGQEPGQWQVVSSHCTCFQVHWEHLGGPSSRDKEPACCHCCWCLPFSLSSPAGAGEKLGAVVRMGVEMGEDVQLSRKGKEGEFFLQQLKVLGCCSCSMFVKWGMIVPLHLVWFFPGLQWKHCPSAHLHETLCHHSNELW